MKKIHYPLLFIISISFLACQIFVNCEKGKGNLVKKEISIEEFHKISLDGNYQLFINQGESQKVFIEAHENLIPYLNKKVTNGKWKISFDPCVESNKSINIYATVVNLNELSIKGYGRIQSESLIKSSKLDLNIIGSGKMNLELDVKDLESEINGSGNMKLSGATKNHLIEVNGSGDIDAYNLVSDNCDIEVNGSGDIKVNVSYDLKAEINGSGDIHYKGNVKNINSSINGSGSLNQAQ